VDTFLPPSRPGAAVVRLALMVHPATAEQAVVGVTQSYRDPNTHFAAWGVEFPARLANGRRLMVSNYGLANPFPPAPAVTRYVFPDIRDPARLLAAFRALVRREGSTPVPPAVEPAGDWLAYLTARLREEQAAHAATGYLRLEPGGAAYRPTWTGAVVLTARLLPPMRQLIRASLRRRARTLLRELGLPDADRNPLSATIERDPLPRATILLLAAALGLVLLQRSGLLPGTLRSPRDETLRLPADFAVPADFPGAVRALERLAGAPARPLKGTDTLGNEVTTPGFEVPVRSRLAESFVTVSQPLFLRRGYFLFRSDQNFDLGGEPDRVAVVPYADQFEALRQVGTNGWNYDIGPDSVVGWLQGLARDEPFLITGLGYDWVSGRFIGPLRDAASLARRFYAFCPDIVDQGTGSAENLVRELRRRHALYCWWD
jgi:hypothetical protein